MRKLLISLLLASAAASPALADRPDRADRDAARAERQAAHDSARSDRSERAAPAERPQPNGQGRFTAPAGGGPQAFVRPDVQQVRPQRGDPRAVEADRAQRGFRGDAPDSVRDWRGPRREQVMQDRIDRRDNESLRRLDRPLPPVMRTRVTPVISDVPRPGTQPPLRVDNRQANTVQWSTDWRRDNRYDWRRWRDRHRSWFRLGIYYDPFGWGYQPFDIGWRLWPNYYSSNFWINDPWEYRLPYAPPGTRWVRYYDDALLVDMWSGQVVDVIHDFFW